MRFKDVIIFVLILIACLTFAATMGVHRYGDSSSYYLMATSLIKDGDFIVDQRDIDRWHKDKFEDVPDGLFVYVDKQGVLRYSKPILYPLFTAPFSLMGAKGFVIINALFLWGSLVFCYCFLRKYLNELRSLLFVTLFFMFSFMPVYVSWVHPEIMSFFLCVLCMWLWLCKNNVILPALIIGIASGTHTSFLLLSLPMIIELTLKKNYKKLLYVLVMCFFGLFIISVLTKVYLGKYFPYAGLRGYLLNGNNCHNVADIINNLRWLVFRENQLYGIGYNSLFLLITNLSSFFIGRFTGLVWYFFPGIVCGAIYILYRRRIAQEDRLKGDGIIVAVFALILALVIARPLNYFGGGDFICNRYFFIAPALLFLPTVKVFQERYFYILFFLLGILWMPQVILNGTQGKNVAKHTMTFPLKYAPFEIQVAASIPVEQFRVGENIYVHAPFGLKRLDDKKFLLDKGGEIVIRVKEIKADFISLETDGGTIVLPSKFRIKSIRDKWPITFFYYKAKNRILVTDIILVPHP